MNFYSKDIINCIIDTSPIEDILSNIDDFYEKTANLLVQYSSKVVAIDYINSLLINRNNNIVFHCMDNEFNINNCPSILIYKTSYNKTTNENNIYILLICTSRKFKNLGFASKLLDDFIIYCKEKFKFTKNKIVLSSLYSSVPFYNSYGFEWSDDKIVQHRTLLQYETYEKDYDYVIMTLNI